MRISLILPLAVLLGLEACALPAPSVPAMSPTARDTPPERIDLFTPISRQPKRWCYEIGNAPARIRPQCTKSPESCEDNLAEARRGGLADGFGDPFSECRPMRQDDIRIPIRISGKAPIYSQKASEAGVRGKLVARCTITVEGTTENCHILVSLPPMDQTVLDVLATWRFNPMLFVGRPVKVEYTFPFVF